MATSNMSNQTPLPYHTTETHTSHLSMFNTHCASGDSVAMLLPDLTQQPRSSSHTNLQHSAEAIVVNKA
jgi:hypothetical protein